MPINDAISILHQVKDIILNSNSWLKSTHDPISEAFDMAINALEREKGVNK